MKISSHIIFFVLFFQLSENSSLLSAEDTVSERVRFDDNISFIDDTATASASLSTEPNVDSAVDNTSLSGRLINKVCIFLYYKCGRENICLARHFLTTHILTKKVCARKQKFNTFFKQPYICCIWFCKVFSTLILLLFSESENWNEHFDGRNCRGIGGSDISGTKAQTKYRPTLQPYSQVILNDYRWSRFINLVTRSLWCHITQHWWTN